MEKKVKNIDGIVARGSTNRSAVLQKKRSSQSLITPKRAPQPVKKTAQKPARVIEVADFAEEPGEDIDNFLAELGYDEGREEAAKIRKEKKTAKNGEKLSRKELKELAKLDRKGKRKKKKALKIVLSVFFSLVVVAGAALGIAYWIGNDFIKDLTGGEGSLWNVITAKPDEPLEKDKYGRTNVLIFGTEGYNMEDGSGHAGWQLTDTIMVLSFYQDTGDVRMVSLPRDLLRIKDRCTGTAKLNETYYCAMRREGDAKKAGESYMRTVSEITGLEMHYYMHANWMALVQIVDALGGIDLAFEYQGDKDKYTGDLPVIWTTDLRGIKDLDGVDFKNGTTAHLNGAMALAVARSRSAFPGASYGSNGNWSREQHQQTVIAAIVQKAKTTKFMTDWKAAFSIKDAIGDNLRMSFKDKEFMSLFNMAKKVDMGSIVSVSIQDLMTTGSRKYDENYIPCTHGVDSSCLSYVFPRKGDTDYSDIQERIRQKFSNNPVTAEGATIDVLNGGGEQGEAKREANKLTEKGYGKGVVGNISGTYTGINIFVVNREMTATTKALEEMYGVKAQVGLPAGVTSRADFVIVIGKTDKTD